jgi:hypothetical protein
VNGARQVATLVDRKSRHLTIVKLSSRHTAVVIPALVQAYARWDRWSCGKVVRMPDKDIPHVTLQVIVKYTTNLQLLGLL